VEVGEGRKWVGCGESAEREVGQGHFWVHQGLLETAGGNQVGHTAQLNLTGENMNIVLKLFSSTRFATK
jgi:hypothetical protein